MNASPNNMTDEAEYNDPRAGKIIADQRVEIRRLLAQLAESDTELHDLRALCGQVPEDWSNAPVWAHWRATDSDGWIYWYENEPRPKKMGYWGRDNGRCQQIVNNRAVDWRKTKCKRPE